MEIISIFILKKTVMIIGNRIKQAREALKISQKDLAERLGMDPSQYSKIERGKVMPTLLQIIEISKIVAKSLDWIVSGKDEVLEVAEAEDHHYKDQLEMAKQNIDMLKQIMNLKDRVRELENENGLLQNKRAPVQQSYPMVAEPQHELTKKGK